MAAVASTGTVVKCKLVVLLIATKSISNRFDKQQEFVYVLMAKSISDRFDKQQESIYVLMEACMAEAVVSLYTECMVSCVHTKKKLGTQQL